VSLSILLSVLLLTPAQSAGKPDSQATAGSASIGFANRRVRNTGILFPRLIRFPDKALMAKVNSAIDQKTSEFGCEGGGKGSYYRVRSRVEYADNKLFSIYATAAYYCGGPYPTNDSNVSLTFDLRTGSLVEFEDLFANYERDREQILKTIFARQIAASERLVASGKSREESCEGDPELYSLEHLKNSEYAFNLSRAGLRIQPLWPHAIESCATLTAVSYGSLAKFAAAGGILPLATAR
jgi:hypothetical protein